MYLYQNTKKSKKDEKRAFGFCYTVNAGEDSAEMKQLEKIKKIIEYVEGNLAQKMSLDQVAGALHYSKYYLHRLFTKTVGMTLHDYLQRRQLTEAAKLLVFSEKSILEIALLSGYESQQAFHGVFKALYKLSPKRYRENERFYPLQLKYDFGSFQMQGQEMKREWNITHAVQEDIPSWMELVRLVIDGFPHLHEQEHVAVVKQRIKAKEAFILKDGCAAIRIMLFSRRTGSIDFMGTHPLYRKKGLPKAFLNKVMGELLYGREISITTYRSGDRADTGHRRQIMDLGFAEAELLVEFGYPTQRFILQKEETNGQKAAKRASGAGDDGQSGSISG